MEGDLELEPKEDESISKKSKVVFETDDSIDNCTENVSDVINNTGSTPNFANDSFDSQSTLQRSVSFDPAILQRPSSHLSIRASIKRQSALVDTENDNDPVPKAKGDESIPKNPMITSEIVLSKDGACAGKLDNVNSTCSAPSFASNSFDLQNTFQRSVSFDLGLLQRPPSHLSIRASVKQQNTIADIDIDPVSEADGEKSISENSMVVSERDVSMDDDSEHVSENVERTGSTPSFASESFDPQNTLQRSFVSDLETIDFKEISQMGGCVECVKAIPVFSEDEIEEGDHIVFAGAVYDHHGIVVARIPGTKEFEIIEATNTISGAVLGISKFFGGKARIARSTKTFNFETQNIRVVEYRIRKNSKPETVEIAKKYADTEKNHKEKFEYNLFRNNCEHFATFCVTGLKFSVQVRKFQLTGRLFLSSGFIGISNEMKRNEKEHENKIICDQCYKINKHLLSVNVRPIKKAEDVRKGDVIRYTYWNLWHEAVVLDVSAITQKHLKCNIAHYAFCGIFSHRTITEETLKINFNGSCSVLEYAPAHYNVYDPETVVERARRRIGEKQFVFFSNDSSHFARWCKLKLEKSKS